MKSAELTYMPIEWLAHHPDNPRRAIGDIKELTASIRESGIMQNLTVVPRRDGEIGYFVVIGNRRLEAAKAAGLTEAPVVISGMDYETQLATMMAENMQRADLTLVEQAHGVQMMMDLGLNVAEIAKKTGLRKDAVERRKALNRYDGKLVEAGVARGATLMDFMELEKVTDEAERTKLLGQIGKPSYRNELNFALSKQARALKVKALTDKLDQFATKMDSYGYIGQKQIDVTHVQTWYALTDVQIEAVEPPKDIRDVRYYWCESNGTVRLLREKLDCTPEDPEEAERKRKSEWAQEKREKANAVYAALKEMRTEWVLSHRRAPTAEALVRAYVRAVLSDVDLNDFAERDTGFMQQMTGVPAVKDGWRWKLEPGMWEEALEVNPRGLAMAILYNALKDERVHAEVWGENPGVEHRENKRLATLYELLESCGYQMTEDEKRYMDGTHEIYCKWEEAEDEEHRTPG